MVCVCGNKFKIKRSIATKGRGRQFCSVKCRNIYNPVYKNPKFGFKKGNIPWNKNKPTSKITKLRVSLSKLGVSVKHSGQFKKGHVSHNCFNPEKHPNRIMAQKGFVSRPQLLLADMVRRAHGQCEIEYTIKTKRSWRFADVAIPELKLDFEYDGKEWHLDPEKDQKRDRELNDVGWEVYHFDSLIIKNKDIFFTKILNIIEGAKERCSMK
jgi:hypothetical protein